jgi:hypothetical protein
MMICQVIKIKHIFRTQNKDARFYYRTRVQCIKDCNRFWDQLYMKLGVPQN